MAAISFVGVGAIGRPMAARLVAAGHAVTAVDPVAVSGADVTVVADLAAAPPAEVVIVMVATPAQLASLVGDAVALGVAGQRWVVMSTVGIDAVQAAGAGLGAAGATVLDVPVTGGVARARTGELTLFAAGDTAAVDTVLACLGTVRPVGERLGDGQAIKVVNQHLASIHLVAAAEVLALTERLGLDAAAVLALVESGAAGSWMLRDRGPRMLADDAENVEVTSTVGIFVKDTGLALDAAHEAGAATPLLDAAAERFRRAADAGLRDRDDSRVIETYRPPPAP